MELNKRQIASRANGSLSRGPKTESGKRRSSANSIRHGLLFKCVVLHSECQMTFRQVHDYFVARFNPTDAVEESLIEEMVAANWRLRRIQTIETALFNEAMEPEVPRSRLSKAFNTLAGPNPLPLLDRYETRLERAYTRAFNNFLRTRKFAETQEPNEPTDSEPTAPQPQAEPEAAKPQPQPVLPNEPTNPSQPPYPPGSKFDIPLTPEEIIRFNIEPALAHHYRNFSPLNIPSAAETIRKEFPDAVFEEMEPYPKFTRDNWTGP